MGDWQGGEITWRELSGSRQVGMDSAVLVFELYGTADEAVARAEAESRIIDPAQDGSYTGLSFDGKSLTGIQVVPDPGATDEESDFGCWRATATYSRRAGAPPALVDSEAMKQCVSVEVDLCGENRRVYAAVSTIQSITAAGGAAVDYKGAINVTGEGKSMKAEGTDVFSLRKRLSFGYTMLASDLTPTLEGTWGDLVGKITESYVTIVVNGKERIYAPRCLRFMGVTYRETKGAETVDVIFHFEHAPTRYNVQIGGIDVGTVAGFDLLSVHQRKKAGAEAWEMEVTQVDVLQGADYGDFSLIPICTPS